MNADLPAGRLVVVSLHSIDITDDTFRITTQPVTAELTASIRTLGLVRPPLLLQQNPDKPEETIVVSGFRRIEACRRLGAAGIPAIVLNFDSDPHTPVPPEKRRRVTAVSAVCENALERPLNPLEQARAIRLIESVTGDEADFQQLTTALGLPSAPPVRQKLDLLTALPPSVQTGVAEGIIPLALIPEYAKIPLEDAERLATFFQRYPAGLNKQREILQTFREIARREDIAVSAVLSEALNHLPPSCRGPDGNRVLHALRTGLRKRRYPSLTAAEDRFSEIRHRLALPPGVRLDPPPRFEGEVYTLAIRFRNPDELARMRDAVSALLSCSDFHRLFSE